MGILGITCLRDDGPYCAEWLAHHLAAGFDRMLVFSHDCSDGSDALLDALAQDSRIAHVSFQPKGKKSVQWQALKLVKEHPWYAAADWAMFFDCDEFLTLPQGGVGDAIGALEARAGSFDAVAIPWRLFGSAGRKEAGEGLTPERFTQAAPVDVHFPLAHLFKTLFRPDAFRQPGVHRPRSKPSKPARWVGPDGYETAPGFAQNDGVISFYGCMRGKPVLGLNHYSLRSVEEFIVKRARGLPNHMEREIGLTYWVERNWNSEPVHEISRMMPQTKEELTRLLDLKDVTTLHDGCRAEHRRRYLELVQDIDVLRLQFRLGLLCSSTPPSAQDGAEFVAAQMKILRGRDGS